MKPWLLAGVLAVIAFGAGLAGALYFAGRLEADIWQDAVVAASRDAPWYQAETDAQFRLANIEAAQHGDTERIIRMNCLLLRTGLPSVRADRFSPARAPDVEAFLERARAAVSNLENQGLCVNPFKKP